MNNNLMTILHKIRSEALPCGSDYGNGTILKLAEEAIAELIVEDNQPEKEKERLAEINRLKVNNENLIKDALEAVQQIDILKEQLINERLRFEILASPLPVTNNP